MLLRPVVAFLALCLATACDRPHATDSQTPQAATFSDDQSLTEDARILRAIEGYALLYPEPIAEDARGGEVFLCGGNWASLGGRSRDAGAYAVEGGEICVNSSEGRSCRRLVSRTDDIVVLSGADGVEVSYGVRRTAVCQADPGGGPSHDITTIHVRGRPSLTSLAALDTTAISELVRGTSIYKVAAGPDFYERFECNSGQWLGIGARAPYHGGYEIRGGQLCVTGPGPNPECSRFYRYDNAYYRGPVQSNGEVLYAFRVEVQRNETCRR